jgi:hypothetical protein
MKVVCFVVMRCTASDHVLGVFGKLSMRRRVHGLGSMTFGFCSAKVLEY